MDTLQILNTLRIMITVLFLVILVYHFSTLFHLLHIFINQGIIKAPKNLVKQHLITFTILILLPLCWFPVENKRKEVLGIHTTVIHGANTTENIKDEDGNKAYVSFDKGHSSGVPLLVFFDEKGTVTRTSDDKAILEGKQITEWILNTTENL